MTHATRFAVADGSAETDVARRPVPNGDTELAQFNVAWLRAPLDSAPLAEFVAGLVRVNALAEAAAGFRWRFQDEAGDATGVRPLGDAVLVNLSVWQDLRCLQAFVYRSAHGDFLRRRHDWFLPPPRTALVLFPVAAGVRPSVATALERLEQLQRDGPSAAAFGFRDAPRFASAR